VDPGLAAAIPGGYTANQSVAKYPSLRGAMDWSTNWDASNGNNFSNTVASHLAGLPK
jgi:chitinase